MEPIKTELPVLDEMMMDVLIKSNPISVDDDAIVTIGITGIAASNAANANAFSADQSFLLWGNNQDSLDAQYTTDIGNTLNPETIEARLPRIWFVQESGTVGSVKVQFDMSNVPGYAGVGENDGANMRLLVDTDETFATGATSIAPTTFDNTTDIVQFDHDFVGGTGFYFTLGSTDNFNTALPVDWLDFEVKAEGCVAQLRWVTAAEVENDHFIVQRSSDRISWEEIQVVDGAGTTMELTEYHFEDASCIGRGTTYYRVIQVDVDGTRESSPVKSANLSLPVSIEVYPVPTSGELTIRLEGSTLLEDAQVNILSLEGRRLGEEVLHIGENKISLNRYAAATYLLEFDIPGQPRLYQRVTLTP